MSDVLDCPDCEGRGNHVVGVDKHGRPLVIGCQLCQGQGKVGGEYGEPAEEPPPPRDVDPMEAEPAWEKVGWDVQGCPTCAGSGEVITLGGAVIGGEARRGAKMPCPTCRPTAAAG